MMARLLLVSCNIAHEPYPVYPIGMTLVADSARAAGHQAELIDVQAAGLDPEQLAAYASHSRPDVVGLSLRNIDNTDAVGYESYIAMYGDIVRELRRVSGAPIVLGGAGYSLFPEELLELTGADYGVVGEGEEAFCQLVERLMQGGAPPAERVWRSESLLEGEEQAGPARDPELAAYYLKTGGMLSLQSKRGCPHRCSYCTYPLLEGRAYRPRPAEAVADELEMLRDNYQADYVAFTDAVFNDQDGYYLELAEELVRREVKVPWMAFFRPQRWQSSEVQLLKRSGLRAVEWGADCATDATLAAMGKGFCWSEVEESNRLFAEAEVCNAHYFMFGGPGETAETVREGLANIAGLERCVVFAFCGVRILPGTPLERLAVNEGMIEPGQKLLEPQFYFSKETPCLFLEEAIAESFEDRRERIFPPAAGQEMVRAFHQLGYRGPIWDLLLKEKSPRRRKRGAGSATEAKEREAND